MDDHAFNNEVVRLVRAALPEQLLKILNRCREVGKSQGVLSLEKFLSILFMRVPSDTRTRLTSVVIFELVKRTLAALDTFLKQQSSLFVEIQEGSEITSLHVALTDKPFVVSSIAESLSHYGIEVELFLHPVIVIDNKPVALSCLKIRKNNHFQKTAIERLIFNTLQCLHSVVIDFDSMTEVTSQVRRSLPQGSGTSEIGELVWEEIADLLNLFVEGSFLFLGANWFSEKASDARRDVTLGYGIWRTKELLPEYLEQDVIQDLEDLVTSNHSFSIRKFRVFSPVHRRVPLIHVLIKTRQRERPYFSLLGCLTSKALAREADDIPVLRRKLGSIVTRAGVLPNSYDFKYIADVLDNMPTDEALELPEEQLLAIVQLAIGVFEPSATRTLSYYGTAKRRATTVIVLPSERESAELRWECAKAVEEFHGTLIGSADIQVDVSKKNQHRLYISVPLISIPESPNFTVLSNSILKIAKTWPEQLREELEHSKQPLEVSAVFPESYRNSVSVLDAFHDCQTILGLTSGTDYGVDMRLQDQASVTITIATSRSAPTISALAPLLDNFGFVVLGAHAYPLASNAYGARFLLHVDALPKTGIEITPERFSKAVGPAMVATLKEDAANDTLNLLATVLGISDRQISLLRAYSQLLWQMTRFSARATILCALSDNPVISKIFIETFESKFDPKSSESINDRAEVFSKWENHFTDAVRSVRDITADKILRALWTLLSHSVRTNFFQSPNLREHHSAIVLKLETSRIEFVPEPRPLFELFVLSSDFEGTHLRSSSVARGGIRWSERPEDYRTEVLGLMKTQTVKNVIIVPSGAKGGFIVKDLPKDPKLIPSAVQATYRKYISALLSVADNRLGAIVHPADCVVYDGPDPYFVVAADKGTATFSDLANEIAVKDYRFWLGDAFASGGSCGYDHKKFGITARGAWECVKRHFHDLGIIYQSAPFTTVGIGDMSGDVFGNGMLMSENMQLIGAFNHRDLFIDPNPDPKKSYAERLRLFNTPRSQWTDYNLQLLSPGGGIFSRSDKEIKLSAQAKQALGVIATQTTWSGEELVSVILRAPVDLLWNGGIGTYVKSSEEFNSVINDSTNDRVRIDATELRAKVVAEGGNLGLSQKARIEYSLHGGRINTDAIDNSGGVDLSDHEVNLKLFLNPLVDSSSITLDERNKLLAEMTEEVCELVLKHNRDQAILLSVSHIWSKESVEGYQGLIREMHRLGFLNRSLDSLPDDEELRDRTVQKNGLYRPELAICSASMKMWIKRELLVSALLEDNNVIRFLKLYFPTTLQKKFDTVLEHHPLRREIIATEITNEILPAVGIPMIHLNHVIFGVSAATVAKNILAADSIIKTRMRRAELLAFDSAQQNPIFMKLWLEAGVALQRATSWLVSCHGDSLSLSEIEDLYGESFLLLIEHTDRIFVGQEKDRFQKRWESYKELGLSDVQCTYFATYRRILPILEVLWTARVFQQSDVRLVASIFSNVLDLLGINVVLKYEGRLDPGDKWEQDLTVNAFRDIRRSISIITGHLAASGVIPENVGEALVKMKGFQSLRDTVQEVQEIEKHKWPFRIAALPVISRQVRVLHSQVTVPT